MVGKLLTNAICLVTVAVVVGSASAQVRNPDGEVGRAVFDVRQGWSRVTNKVMDSNGSLTNLVLTYPHNETLSWKFIWDFTRQFEDNDNVFALGLKYFSKPIGAGVDMNPDGALGSVGLDLNVGYWRPNFSKHEVSLVDIAQIVDYIGHGVHASGGLTIPMMTRASLLLNGEVNVAQIDAVGVDTYRIYGGGGAVRLYSHVLTYDDAQANPDGPIGSMYFETGGGYRRVGGFNHGLAHGEFGMPLATWVTWYGRYAWHRGGEARATVWSAFFLPGLPPQKATLVWAEPPTNNFNQVSFGFRFY